MLVSFYFDILRLVQCRKVLEVVLSLSLFVANLDQNLVTIGSKESRLASMLELLAPTGSS